LTALERRLSTKGGRRGRDLREEERTVIVERGVTEHLGYSPLPTEERQSDYEGKSLKGIEHLKAGGGKRKKKEEEKRFPEKGGTLKARKTRRKPVTEKSRIRS